MKVISVEGIDGAGKTAIVAALTQHLAQNYRVPLMVISELNDGAVGEQCKRLIMSSANPHRQLAAVEYARLNALAGAGTTLSALDNHVHIYDRYLHSTLAYQGSLPGMTPDRIRCRHIDLNFPLPDLTIYLQLSPAIAHERLRQRHLRGGTLNEFDKLPGTRVQQMVEIFDRECGEDGAAFIDASQPFEACSAEALQHLDRYFRMFPLPLSRL
jgi:thymidylate kinase